MDAKEFASAYGEAFRPAAGLPLLFWYSDGPVRAVPKVEGCFFKALAEAREGSAVSLNAANIGCGGGKFYTGFAPMPPFVPAFVSQKEHYKQTPEMVLEFIGRLGVPEASGAWLNFARIDTPQAAEAFGTADGALFFATPDILSGLVSWAVYDNNADDAVCAPFGSGCSAVVTQAVRENRRVRTQRLPGVVRPFGASVGRRLGAGVRRADVAFARDVRHDACKLSFRDPCVEQGPGPH